MWWEAEASGPDELAVIIGKGLYRCVDRAKRYRLPPMKDSGNERRPRVSSDRQSHSVEVMGLEPTTSTSRM